MAVKITKIDADNPDPEVLARAAKLISEGKTIVCPTDTGYAFAANAIDLKAVARVFELKGRSYSNPIHVAVHSLEAAEKYAYFNEAARYLARKFLPGALTMVLPKKEIIPSLLVSEQNTVGIRIPANRVILELAARTSLPITATSANISGKPTPYSGREAVEQLGGAIKSVALVLEQGLLPSRELSTIIDLTVEPPQLIRQGRISWLELRQVLRAIRD
jgi:L-threonylcarbamoyladenylate synthase